LSTILVTGGAGYIGSHACKALAASGRIPVTYDSLERGHRDAVRWGPFEQGDILDRDRLDYVIGKYEPAAVLHFAGLAFVGESVADPARYYRNNLAGSLVLLEAMRDNWSFLPVALLTDRRMPCLLPRTRRKTRSIPMAGRSCSWSR
jgi:UDP-glucose 4-epimerase